MGYYAKAAGLKIAAQNEIKRGMYVKEWKEVIGCPYRDAVLALWMKGIIIVLTVFHIFALELYGGGEKGVLLLGIMIVLMAGNLIICRKRNYAVCDWIVFLCLEILAFFFIRGAYIGYFSMFYLLILSAASIFVLGIKISLIFQVGCLGGILYCLKTDWCIRLYDEQLVLRYPYLYLCIMGICYIIMYSIQKYWVEKEKRQKILEHRIRKEKEKLAETSLKVITSMYRALSAKIPEIDQHCEQVATDSKRIAKELWKEQSDSAAKWQFSMNAYYAGLLHEVGTVGLPDEILQNETLTEEQYAVYQGYVESGYQIIRELQVVDEVAEAVRFHRENYDGSGYLTGKKGEEIPILARILAVADYTDRHRRRGEAEETIISLLREKSGAEFDPKIVELMCGLLRE